MSQAVEIKIRKGQKFSDAIRDHDVIVVKFKGKLYDLDYTAPEDGVFIPVKLRDEEGLTVLRHSAAHLLAHAVTSLYKGALPNTGPPTEDGFYYDIKMDPISSDELPKIEKKMKEIASKNLKIERLEYDKDTLVKIFSGNRFKLNIIEEKVPDGSTSTVYRQGDFVDLCTGPHVPSTSYLKAVKLLSLASTNYRGDINGEPLVRIYGTAFPDQKSLNEYLRMREEAIKRDHRKIGQEMDLFIFNSERAPGFPLYTPYGTTLRNSLVGYMRELNRENGWSEVYTPHIFRDSMWKKSGHYAKYRESMYTFQMDDDAGYAIKPMNCPGHVTIFEREQHSFRDLPVRYSEPGTVYRYEKSGEVGGLTRPRMFTIDDGHAFVREDQIVSEVTAILGMIRKTFTDLFGKADLTYELSVIDKDDLDNYLITYRCSRCQTEIESRKTSQDHLICPNCGSTDLKPDLDRWDAATSALRNALQSQGVDFKEFEGEAAFYGPKIDVHLRDALGRSWQLSTVQVDFNLPLNFDLTYVDSGGERKHVVMIHRAIYGSYERIMAILLEHYAGKLPTWLSPIQVYITPVSDRFLPYTERVHEKLLASGIRSFLDYSKETVNKKIRMNRKKRPSYIVIIGEKEVANSSVSVRNRRGDVKAMALDEFINMLRAEISHKRVEQPDFQ